MKFQLGKYKAEVSEPFTNEKDAIDFVLKSFPELTKEEVKPYVKPLIKKQKDESNSAKTRNSEGDPGSSKNN
ncbi:hypothetical protein [Chryseobacterium daeguense]|uniref:hypothetical protein n=1 Tax=Chryseobacterium daeguense TaxID=412438 RepID=UPI0004264523|nr:hypothetical protein [Chryseobacterium daeguense]